MNDAPDTLDFADLVVERAEPLARDVVGFTLRHPEGAELAPFTAGSHIPVRTPSGAIRRYSLCNAPQERGHYQIAVKREAAGRGGSISMTDGLKAGDRLPVAAPRSEFGLAPRARRFLFIAGGIGITPILSMMRDLAHRGDVPMRLVYLTRDAGSAAFADVLAAEPFAAVSTLHHDGGDPERAYDLWPLLEKPTQAHVYCCGPRGLMDAVRDMSGHWPFGSVHFESFGVDAALRSQDVAFDVTLARDGRTLHVPADRSILEVLRDNGIRVRSSCEAGSCGSCRTGLLEGEVEHRDFVLTEAERESAIMVCCSRSRGTPITLEL